MLGLVLGTRGVVVCEWDSGQGCDMVGFML